MGREPEAWPSAVRVVEQEARRIAIEAEAQHVAQRGPRGDESSPVNLEHEPRGTLPLRGGQHREVIRLGRPVQGEADNTNLVPTRSAPFDEWAPVPIRGDGLAILHINLASEKTSRSLAQRPFARKTLRDHLAARGGPLLEGRRTIK